MITDLWIENFKGIGKRQHIPLRPITLLFGANSAGKSTVLHALLYLRKILVNHEFEPTLPLDGENTVSLGPFNEFLHDNIELRELPQKHKLTIGVRFQPSESSVHNYVQLFDRRRLGNLPGELQAATDPESEPDRSAKEPSGPEIHLSGPIDVHFTIVPNRVESRFATTDSDEYERRRQLKRLTISVGGSPFFDMELRLEEEYAKDSEEMWGYVNLMSSVWNGPSVSEVDYDVELSILRSESNIVCWPMDKDFWKMDPQYSLLALSPLGTVEMREINLDRAVELFTRSNSVLRGFSTVRLTRYLQKICPEEQTAALAKVLGALPLESEFECLVILATKNKMEELELVENAKDPNRLIGVLFPDAISHKDISSILDIIRTLHFRGVREKRDPRASWTRRLKVADYRSLLPSEDPVLAVSFARDPFVDIQQSDSAGRIEQDDSVSQIVKGSLFCLAAELRELIYVGPKRSTVPRTFSSDHFPGCTNWGAGLAAWKWLLEADPDDVRKCNDWLASAENGLGTGFEIVVISFRVMRESNSDWPSVYELEPFSAESRPKPDIEYLDRIKEAYESITQAYQKSHRFKKLHLRDIDRSTIRHPQDLGEGITQVVPVIVSCVKAEKSEGFVAIEQPELHLHPSLAAKLGDLLISTMFTERGARALIETHSEHLILRILRRIRQTTDGELPAHIPPVKPDDVCVLWVDNLGDGTIFKHLEINKFGDFIDRWPRGFFTERSEELF